MTEHVDLALPARPDYLVVMRSAAAGIAERKGLSFDEIEDVKVAVAEACTEAILADAERLHVHFEANGELTISVIYAARHPRLPEDSELGLFLIRTLMDDVITGEEAGRQVLRMVKQRPLGAGEGQAPAAI